jgi:hypothetical protein
MSTITTECNAAVIALALDKVKNAPKRDRVRREHGATGAGDQLTKLFAKATASAVAREDRNAITGQLKAAKTAVGQPEACLPSPSLTAAARFCSQAA